MHDKGSTRSEDAGAEARRPSSLAISSCQGHCVAQRRREGRGCNECLSAERALGRSSRSIRRGNGGRGHDEKRGRWRKDTKENAARPGDGRDEDAVVGDGGSSDARGGGKVMVVEEEVKEKRKKKMTISAVHAREVVTACDWAIDSCLLVFASGPPRSSHIYRPKMLCIFILWAMLALLCF